MDSRSRYGPQAAGSRGHHSSYMPDHFAEAGCLSRMDLIAAQSPGAGPLFDDPLQVQQWVTHTDSACPLSGPGSSHLESQPMFRDDSLGLSGLVLGGHHPMPPKDALYTNGLPHNLHANAGPSTHLDSAICDGSPRPDSLSFEPWASLDFAHDAPEMVPTLSSDSHNRGSFDTSQTAWSSPVAIPMEHSQPSSYSRASVLANQVTGTLEDLHVTASPLEDRTPFSPGCSGPSQATCTYAENQHFDQARFVEYDNL